MTATSRTTTRGKCLFFPSPLIVNSVNLQNSTDLLLRSSSTADSMLTVNIVSLPDVGIHPHLRSGESVSGFFFLVFFWDVEGSGCHTMNFSVVTNSVCENTPVRFHVKPNLCSVVFFRKQHRTSEPYHPHIRPACSTFLYTVGKACGKVYWQVVTTLWTPLCACMLRLQLSLAFEKRRQPQC